MVFILDIPVTAPWEIVLQIMLSFPEEGHLGKMTHSENARLSNFAGCRCISCLFPVIAAPRTPCPSSIYR